MSEHDMAIFSGSSNKKIAKSVASRLDMRLGDIVVGVFSDGETKVEINENVRGKNVYIIQSTCSPTNHNVMELLITIDAMKRAAAKEIVAVIPYYGYARQDRRPGYARVPITAKLVADQLKQAGCTHVVTVDLHAEQIQGFFDVPFINATATRLFAEDINMQHRSGNANTIIVSPDVGGVARARKLASIIGKGDMDLAIIDKRRPADNIAEVMNIIGDVEGRDCILIDDIVDTAGTLCKAAQALVDSGANSVVSYCTHAVLSGKAIENISNSVLTELVVTDTIPRRNTCEKIRVLSTTSIIADTISRIQYNQSVSRLYTSRRDIENGDN